MAAAVAGGVAVGLRGLLTGRGSAASSGADRRARHGAQLRRHSPRGGGGRPGVGVSAQALAHVN